MKTMLGFGYLVTVLVMASVAQGQTVAPLHSDTGTNSNAASPIVPTTNVPYPPGNRFSQGILIARAGAINFAEGDVSFKSGTERPKMALVGDQMRSGDTISTGDQSRAEILLTPGSYLRLGSNTVVRLDNDLLDELKVSVLRGSVIVEEASFGKLHPVLAAISTPKGEFFVDHMGVYRFEVNESGAQAVEVERGKLSVNGKAIGPGKKASLDGVAVAPTVASLGKNSGDEFDSWSKKRARMLVGANRTLLDPLVTSPPVYSSGSDPQVPGSEHPIYGGRAAWGGACGGSWYFDLFFGAYTFLPAFRDATIPPKSFRSQPEESMTSDMETPPPITQVYGGQECPDAFSGYGWRYPTFGGYLSHPWRLDTLRGVLQPQPRSTASLLRFRDDSNWSEPKSALNPY